MPFHRPYRLTDVTVVDPRDASHLRHRDVHVRDGRIVDVTAAAGGSAPEDVDGAGRFVVPGYVDMHTHALTGTDPARDLALMLSFGITGYRQMSGTPRLLARRRAGELDVVPDAPRLLATPGALLTPLNAADPRAAIAEARRQADAGADFLKAGLISPEVYFAVQEEADRLGLPVCGHLPAGIDVRAAAMAGFRSVEHVGPGLGVLAGCSCHEQHLRTPRGGRGGLRLPKVPLPAVDLSSVPLLDRLVATLLGRIVLNPAQFTTPGELTALREAIDTFDEGRARELAHLFAQHGTWHCPTLVRLRGQLRCDAVELAGDPDLALVGPSDRRRWVRAAERFRAKFDASARELLSAQFDLIVRVVGVLAREGVPLLAGTDSTGAVWVVPGAALHEEFDLLAASGLDAPAVLRATTVDAARYLGHAEAMGTVEPGKVADMVLLDRDPVVAVAHLHSVSGVVVHGLHHGRRDIARLRSDEHR
ncbi:amidohydrolase family protein [Pseudonocardia alni]|uniref:amidohydrolase family protein n=1 Tax=Pseudonocardia alni TaxID=33907 RepID=UPI00280ABA35|nr:amidohydrolase family protein [Pseudonocardia alni]